MKKLLFAFLVPLAVLACGQKDNPSQGGGDSEPSTSGLSKPANVKLVEAGVADGSMYLARSGGDTSKYDNVTYVNCEMSSVIAPAGWHTGKTPTPAAPTAVSGWKEYGTTGVSTSNRNNYGKILTADEAAAFSSKEAVLGW